MTERSTDSEPTSAGTTVGFLATHTLLASAFAVAMAANVALTVLMGRMLDPVQFGTLGLVVAIFLFCALPGGAIQVLVVKRTARCEAEGTMDTARRFAGDLTRMTLLGAAIAVAGIWLTGPALARLFRLDSSIPLVLIVAALGIWLVLGVNRGVMQGRRHFGALSASIIAEAVLRVGFAALFVAIRPSATSAALAVLVSTTVAWLASLPTFFGLPPPDGRGKGAGGGEAVGVVITMALIAFMQNADVFVVKARFEPAVAGQYVATATIGKAFFFMALAVSAQLLPGAAIAGSNPKRLRLLARSAAMIAAMAAPVVAIAFSIPGPVVGLVYGSDRTEMAAYLGLLTLSSIFLSVAYLEFNYLAALGRGRFLPPAAAVVVSQVLFFAAIPSITAITVVVVVVTANATLAMLLALVALFEVRTSAAKDGLDGGKAEIPRQTASSMSQPDTNSP